MRTTSSNVVWLNIFHVYSKFRTRRLLRSLICNRKVLILGSGPSAVGLVAPPDDYLVFGCNYSANTLPNRELDIYLYSDWCSVLRPDFVEKIASKTNTKYKLSNHLLVGLFGTRYFEDVKTSELYSSFKSDIPSETLYWPSTGLHLCYLSILNKAREIYLSGFEFEYEHYGHWNDPLQKSGHQVADLQLLELIRQTQIDIFSCSPESGSSKYFRYKPFV